MDKNISIKICIVCGIEKPHTSEFFEPNRNQCKKCRSEKAKERRKNKKEEDPILFKCHQMASDAYSRIFAPSREYKTNYRNLIDPFGFKNIPDMRAFLYENFYHEIENLDHPSVDRIDDSRGYTKDNIRILSHSENTLLGVNKRRRMVKVIFINEEEKTFESVADCVEFFGYSRNATSKIKSWILRDGQYQIPFNIKEVQYLS